MIATVIRFVIISVFWSLAIKAVFYVCEVTGRLFKALAQSVHETNQRRRIGR